VKRLERFLIVSGLALLGVYGVALAHREILSRASLRAFERATRDLRQAETIAATAVPSPPGIVAALGTPATVAPVTAPAAPALAKGAPPRIDFSLWSDERVGAYRLSLQTAIDVPLAVLKVPKIGLVVPVLEGTDDFSLNRGVGHIEGTPRPGETGNVGIAGHRDGFFRGLKDVMVGDRLEVVTRKGSEGFKVDRITIVAPEEVSVLDATVDPSVTLVTCYPFYFVGDAPQRYIVWATRFEGPRGR
jgi:LPXTG-site transpeptidase (sortase) family protein